MDQNKTRKGCKPDSDLTANPDNSSPFVTSPKAALRGSHGREPTMGEFNDRNLAGLGDRKLCSRDTSDPPTEVYDKGNKPLISHPSKQVNAYLLQKVPYAKMAITSDWDWIELYKENGGCMPSPDRLPELIDKLFDIRVEDGAVFLERRGQVHDMLLDKPSDEEETVHLKT